MKRSCKLAFTLAEVLITLGVIGVVSAMTLPTLVQNYRKKSYVVQLHKIYNEFQQAFVGKMTETNAVNLAEAGFHPNEGFAIERQFLNSHFKVIKDCGENTTNCFANSYVGLNGTRIVPNFRGYKVAIASGASISFYIDGIDDGENETTDDYLGFIYVDTNGLKGPNIGGRDLFRMYIYPDGVIDDWQINVACRRGNDCPNGENPREARESNFERFCDRANDTDGCFGKLLNDNWEMRY